MTNLQLITALPQSGVQTVENVVAAVAADEAQFLSLTPGSTTVVNPATGLIVNGGVNAGATDQTMVGGKVVFAIIAVPTAPVGVATGGTGTSYVYKAEALLGTGSTGVSAASNTVSGGATLSATVYNTITFTMPAGCTSVNIRRTTGGSTQGIIANVLNTGAPSYVVVDTGLVGDASTAPTLNTTATLSASLANSQEIISGSTGVITIPSGDVLLTYASGASAVTLAVPPTTWTGKLTICSISAEAHTITTPTNGFNGAHSVYTFSGSALGTLTIVANNGTWTATALGGGALSA
jgi:hypothetical protein